ncbi:MULTISPECIES: hypothetical protein [Bradyrhizobium]|jgi:hypothetical protein|uniref:hypothetical protein n=1 Tax=Bradyrhizobium TaxID=374 RepID=UPI0012BD0363|nr:MULTISPECIES: hypothetical protein [Bradyrhizobium]MCS3447432.1 hypothetical protein [Bradyrhizobium elkanii]MCS3561429.1 hypothetical protein [Bradyrhizobium elkanii]MCW2148728.1 hypothetical protein [Bradyrhizobium elkanii]MCW2352184.1 hypothetical protein [Bradyrhizobium elkanii]MCW2372457.1 hypothetical protein [Bradyrhizobium elkanii]
MGISKHGSRLNLAARRLRPTADHRPILRSVPLELAGDWGNMVPAAALHVLERMREACFDAVRLVSDDQPARLRVDEHPSGGPPAIWLHSNEADLAWIIVDIGERDWSRLAYQFGHELGHVTANSWRANAKPGGPCQWLEEAMVEAFSLRGLSLLADSWSRDPPFQDDSGFGAAVALYRQNIVESYGKLAVEQGNTKDFSVWFRQHRATLEARRGLSSFAQVASLSILTEYERAPSAMEALGALNRWPGRSTIPLENYLYAWQASCRELRVATDLPLRLRTLLGLG